MKSLRLFVMVVLIFTFTAGVVLAQPPAAPAAGEGKGAKMTPEQRHEKREAAMAKGEEQFKKFIDKINEMLVKAEQAIASGKINEQMKANLIKKIQDGLQNADTRINDMKERMKMIEGHIKAGEELKAKVNALLSKLQSYTPPAKQDAPGVPEKK